MSVQLGVGALIFDYKERILLQYRLETNFYSNCWFIPCGKSEDGEDPIRSIIREVKEETSLEVGVVREVYNKLNERGTPEIAYECCIINGAAKSMEPTNFKELKYFDLSNLPKDTGKRTLEIIAEYQKSRQNID